MKKKKKKNYEQLQKIGKVTLNDPEFNFRKSLDTLFELFFFQMYLLQIKLNYALLHANYL